MLPPKLSARLLLCLSQLPQPQGCVAASPRSASTLNTAVFVCVSVHGLLVLVCTCAISLLRKSPVLLGQRLAYSNVTSPTNYICDGDDPYCQIRSHSQGQDCNIFFGGWGENAIQPIIANSFVSCHL